MYRKPACFKRNSQARILKFDQQQPAILVLLGITVCFSLILFVVKAPKVSAATHTFKDTYQDLVQHKQTQTVGYQVALTRKLSSMAEDAFKQDEYVLAKRAWRMLAESGNPEAAYKLAMLFDTGADGVNQDSAQAAYWYLQAAEAGHLHAQHNLAVAYASGDGVEMDISKALKWWKRAAQVGNKDSQYNLGILYAMGTHGVKKNLEKAKKWWRKAAMKGDPMAQYNLGTIYANGEGHVRSYCEAIRWWEKSASSGVKQASWALEVIKTRRDFHACW
jgi:TPR repeat protein